MSYGSWLRARIAAVTQDGAYHLRNNVGRITGLYRLYYGRRSLVHGRSYFPEEARKGKWGILMDQFCHVLRYGEVSLFYFAMGFDRKHKPDLEDYLPLTKLNHIRYKKNYILPDCEDYNFICLLTDKFTFGCFCRGAGFPTPTNIALVDGNHLQLIADNRLFSLDQLTDLTLDAYCKIVSGREGKGTFHLEVRDRKLYGNGSELTPGQLKHRLAGHQWVVQQRISDQHELLAALHPDSVNTIRLLTVHTGSGVDVLSGALRMGVNGSKVDNWGSGGILVPIDLTSGNLRKHGFFKPGRGTKTDRHPNSQIVFEGYPVPHLEAAIDIAIRLHRLMYGVHSIGWDIAVTQSGPLFVEGNSKWDFGFEQVASGGFKRHFEKYFLRANSARSTNSGCANG